MHGGQVQSLVGEDPACGMAWPKKKKKNYFLSDRVLEIELEYQNSQIIFQNYTDLHSH